MVGDDLLRYHIQKEIIKKSSSQNNEKSAIEKEYEVRLKVLKSLRS